MAAAAYTNHVAKTRDVALKWDVEFVASQKILCYCDVWLGEKDEGDNRSQHNATQFEVCKSQTFVPDMMDYGTPAAKVDCNLTSVASYPGTLGFITQEYSGFTDFVQESIPCTLDRTPVPKVIAPDPTVVAAAPMQTAYVKWQGYCRSHSGETTVQDKAIENHEPRSASANGGWCDCGSQASAASCWEFTASMASRLAIEYSDGECYPMQALPDAPTDCPSGCLAQEGTGTVLDYAGDRNVAATCLIKAPSMEAPTTETQTAEAPEAPTIQAVTTKGSDLYTFGENGIVDGCPLGYAGISNITACKHAAHNLGYTMRTSSSHHSTAYPGCYFYEPSKRAYFNTHPNPDGTWHKESTGQICVLEAPTPGAPTTEAPPTLDAPTTESDVLHHLTPQRPGSEAPTTEAPTTEPPLYILGNKGMKDGCPLGYAGIFVEPVCEEAAEELGLNIRSGTSNHATGYPGCYFYKPAERAYFNAHPDPDGTWHSANAGQICVLEIS